MTFLFSIAALRSGESSVSWWPAKICTAGMDGRRLNDLSKPCDVPGSRILQTSTQFSPNWRNPVR